MADRSDLDRLIARVKREVYTSGPGKLDRDQASSERRSVMGALEA